MIYLGMAVGAMAVFGLVLAYASWVASGDKAR